ncbi:hypothetical protein EN780_24760 [Mesorhizobium sp. M4B.F.Ca.ET.089.01.1.1]|nr:hypothetical protein EN780_24760 [Mesorhizobium sp. M4B.F.Ca.ET.089.01.1.1]
MRFVICSQPQKPSERCFASLLSSWHLNRSPTAYCLLPTAYCLLPTAYCLLPTAYCLTLGAPL